MRFTIDPMAASSVNFPVGGLDGVWYTMHPVIHAELKGGGDHLGTRTNAEIVEEAKRRKFKITGSATFKTIWDKARPDLKPKN